MIRVYKTLYNNGSADFTEKKDGVLGSGHCGSVRSLVMNVQDSIQFEKEEYGTYQINVSFTPPYDISCHGDLAPGRCMPLSQEEQDEFWKDFVRPPEELEEEMWQKIEAKRSQK